ncbi:MAG: sensor histidine kinase [Verrucomicrobiaceae bacterium]|nr:MAG: sensor histidine kinase [Verrucomicrobiaceae bacterium]
MAAKTAEAIGARWPDVMPRPEFRITLLYLMLAGLWVVLSDHVVHVVLPNSSASVQTLKGLNFVLTTSLLLFFVLRRAYRGWREAERRNRELIIEMSDGFRLLSARSERLREEERTRISRELHDQLGQALTSVTMDLRWLEGRLERLEDQQVNPLIDRLVEAEEQVGHLLVGVQSIAADLRPDALDRLGLRDALVHEAKRFQERTGIAVAVEADELPEEIPREVATGAYRIFQEAMTNVVRHAEATKVTVLCAADESRLSLTVVDNGKGMSPEAERGRQAIGLLGMRERAELCGGTFRVLSSKGGGTEVSAAMPWKQA